MARKYWHSVQGKKNNFLSLGGGGGDDFRTKILTPVLIHVFEDAGIIKPDTL